MLTNLLPETNKRYVWRVYQTHRLIAVGVAMNLLLLVVLVLVLVFNNLAYTEKVAIEDLVNKSNQKSEVVEFNQLKKTVNQLGGFIRTINALPASKQAPSDVLTEILMLKNKGIRLTTIDYSVDKAGSEVHLSGVFAARQDLHDFVGKLEDLPKVKLVDAPVTNIVSETNGVFTLNISYDKP